MAGSQDPSDNPVAINVVPLVDVIFCLCVFFMCSFKFRQAEARFDAWLPKTQGLPDSEDAPWRPPAEIRVAVLWDERSGTSSRVFGSRKVTGDDDLRASIEGARDAAVARGVPDVPLTIDADPRVPWDEVVAVVNLAKACSIADIQFAMGAPPERRR